MEITGWILVAIGTYLFISGVVLLSRVTILRIEAGISYLLGWRKVFKWYPRKRLTWLFLGDVTRNALDSGDKPRMSSEATALATESIAFFATSAFLASLGAIFISIAN